DISEIAEGIGVAGGEGEKIPAVRDLAESADRRREGTGVLAEGRGRRQAGAAEVDHAVVGGVLLEQAHAARGSFRGLGRISVCHVRGRQGRSVFWRTAS